MRFGSILPAVAVLSLSMCIPLTATIYLNDGAVHDIDYVSTEQIRVDEGMPGVGTTLNILDGGYVRDLSCREDSVVGVAGGQAEFLTGMGNSRITMSDGIINTLSTTGNSSATITGGRLDGAFVVENSQLDIIGGKASDLFYGSSMGCIEGGEIRGTLYVVEYAVLEIRVDESYLVDGGWVTLGEISDDDYYYSHLTLPLVEGGQVDVDLYIMENGKVVIIPEPVTVLLVGLGALGVLRRRR